MSKRLFIVSNRLPLTIRQEENRYISRQSSGGLISAISSYLNNTDNDEYSEISWVGVPGCSQSVWSKAALSNPTFTYSPVFVEDELYDGYYNGFSNSLVWPLFHYFPSFAQYSDDHYDAYIDVNRIFSEILESAIKPGDVVWIHDYHLLPLADMLRKRVPLLTIGFFLHIPFPSYELFRVIPKTWQAALLKGMLGADLIGFHTVDYSRHFLSCLQKTLHLEQQNQVVFWENRQIKIDAFPIGIDFDQFYNADTLPEVNSIINAYSETKGNRKLIFSVDRLDYTKGISNRLKGYERFLFDNPGYIGKVIFALTIVPSRDSITKYAERKRMIDEYIGSLNSRLGNMTWQPVIYQYTHLSFEELNALYRISDLALITPLRDGMNLVAKEFVAARKDRTGVLILSEMAGAARELTEALLINPNDSAEISESIRTALEMPIAEQWERMEAMQQRIKSYDVVTWAADFFEQLKLTKEAQLEYEVKYIDKMVKVDLLHRYQLANKKVFLLDYDGSLMPFSKYPQEAIPSAELLSLLKELAASPENSLYIISGRDSETLESWLGHLPIGLIAEHGAKIRQKDGSWNKTSIATGNSWMPIIKQVMGRYVTKCPHSFIEQKEFSLAWHYRNADLGEGIIRAEELYTNLMQVTADYPLNVLKGNKVIEVRMKGVNKGRAVDTVLNEHHYDFIFSVGDDKTDEDMFQRLAKMPESFTIKVGTEASFAKFNLHSPAMVQSLLQTMAHCGAKA